MKLKFLNSEYRNIKRKIRSCKKQYQAYCVLEYKLLDEDIYSWFEQKGYKVEYIEPTIVCISFEGAIRSKALKDKQYVVKGQYIEIVNMIERRKSDKYHYLKIYSKGKYVLDEVKTVLNHTGYRTNERKLLINNEQWIEVEIKWGR